ncbi:hypothetical protein [Pantoea cypripedii]|uniref:hypothetical protein n=1 Tax=Pantoea cypripedii TaxID=55209 RepID=UPI00111C5826|nr:hypothetical protein [Pantoea cypripedii]MBP2199298.1 hypothetical protein [Pantoea cypripedii]
MTDATNHLLPGVYSNSEEVLPDRYSDSTDQPKKRKDRSKKTKVTFLRLRVFFNVKALNNSPASDKYPHQ